MVSRIGRQDLQVEIKLHDNQTPGLYGNVQTAIYYR